MNHRTFVVIALVSMMVTIAVSAETTTVILVRHAEKEGNAGPNPELTDEGTAHAAALARELADVDLSAIYSTPFKRTRNTAAPVAEAKALDVTITDAGSDLAKKTAESILSNHKGETVLVVGHSNTLGATIEALGGGKAFDLDESEYGDLFVCMIPEGQAPTVLRLKAWLPQE